MKTSADLGKDPVSSLVLRLAIPAMIAQFVNVLYSIIDRMYIGHIPGTGALALAGVGVCGPIVTLLSSFGTLVGLGGSILLGIRMGEGNLPKARQILSNSFLMLCGFSVILTAGLNYFINCQGFPVAGMMTVLIGAVSNIILDPVFIFLFHMDVAGAAIATVISQMASCAFALLFLFSKKVHVRISFGNYSRKLMLNILYLGMSPFLILATDSILLIVMNTVLQKYGGPEQGDMLITCATIVQSYMLLITSPMIGISGGTQAIISYNYGARQTQRVKKTVRTNLKLMLLFTTFMFILSRFIPGTFVRLFTSSQEYMDFSVWGIKVFTMMIIPLSFQYVFVDALTALERTKTALFLSILRKLLYVAGTITLPLFFQASAAFYAEPLSDAVSAVISSGAFLLIIDRHLNKREQAMIS